jgi:hypothetical protein
MEVTSETNFIENLILKILNQSYLGIVQVLY